MVGPITETDKGGNIISIDFGPMRETIKGKDGTKVEISYHILPNCHDDEPHMGRKYNNFFRKKKYFDKSGKLIKEEKGLNPNVRKPDKDKLKRLEKIVKEDEELRKEGRIYFNPIVM